MSTVKMTLAALGLATLLSTSALAQRPEGRGPGGPGGPGGLYLLTNKSVQTELKLDDSQVEKAKKLADETRDKNRERFESLQKLDRAERGKKGAELMKEAAEENKKVLGEVLKPDQLKRYHQIVLQQRGASALGSPEVQDELKLTADQKEKVKAIQTGAREKMQEIRKDTSGDRAAAREKFQTFQKEQNEKYLGILTDDQKKAWQDMLGAPFEIKREARP